MYDLQNAGKHCQSWRRSPSQNESTRCCSWRAAGVDTVANTRWYKSLWCQLPGRIYHSIWKRITCRMEKDDEIWTTSKTFFFFFFFSSVNASTWERGGLEMVSSLDWNVAPLWFWRTLEIIDEFRQWKSKLKKKTWGCCRYKNRRLLYSATWKTTAGEAIRGETRSVLVNPLI